MIKKTTIGIFGAILMTAFAQGAFADTTVDISGNGSDSYNKVKVKNENTTVVDQTNVTKVTTVVDASASTGGNKANSNTGGDVTVDTGDASNTVIVTVLGGSNTASVDPCACEPGNTDVTVSGNGEGSTNKTKVKNSNATYVGQYSKTKVYTYAYLKAKTGKNKASKNTGGTVDLTTGGAENSVDVLVTSGSNDLNP